MRIYRGLLRATRYKRIEASAKWLLALKCGFVNVFKCL
jgi:hypothetical protein